LKNVPVYYYSIIFVLHILPEHLDIKVFRFVNIARKLPPEHFDINVLPEHFEPVCKNCKKDTTGTL
jgi:hypothetical protein